MQPHSASLRGRHGWSAGHLAGSRLLASPARGVWVGESKQELSAVIHRRGGLAAEGPRPEWAARDGLVGARGQARARVRRTRGAPLGAFNA